MKTLFSFLCLVAITASAQYQIDWFTIDGGGGQSSGGAYTLAGTIGQPDAATSSGGNYALQGGFWSAFAVMPTEGSPTLRILLNGASVILAWPNPSPGFQLQESPSLSAPSWTDVNTAPVIVGDEKQLSQPLTPTMRFYRLHQP